MEECYTLLEIAPNADSEEIERAYQNKKLDLEPDRFEQGTEEWLRAAELRRKLDDAYNQAIMGTFTTIRAFAPSRAPEAPQTPAQPHVTPSQASVQHPAPPLRIEHAEHTEQSTPISPAAQISAVLAAPAAFDDYAPVQSNITVRPASVPLDNSTLRKLVEEAPVSFTDDQLLNMDIAALRESCATPKSESVLLTWGIEDKLLRTYVMTYAGFVIFDLIVKMSLGGSTSFSVSDALRQMDGAGMTGAVTRAQPPSAIISILMSFVSTAYFFLCSLPMPIVTRFFLLGQPAEKGMIRWSLYTVGVAAAAALYSLTSWLLPQGWSGNSISLAFVAFPLCAATLTHEG